MFNYYQPTRIHFGVNRTDEIGEISSKYGKKCLLVTTADQPLQKLYERVKNSLVSAGIEVIHFDQVVPNPSLEVVELGVELARKEDVEFLVALGGGSSIDTAKSIAFKTRASDLTWDEIFENFDSHREDYASRSTSLPILSIPTTSGTGSQVTQAAVITRGEEKLTFFHPDLFSKETIIDPQLTTTLPVRMSAATGFDTFTHAFESYVNGHGSFYSKMDSVQAMKLVIEYLPLVVKDPGNVEYREKLSLADTLGGRALANAGAHTPHPLSEIIGGIINVPHGDALAAVYPAYINNSLDQLHDAFDDVAKLFGSNKTADDLEVLVSEFLESINLRTRLSDYKMSDEDFNKILSHPVLGYLPFGSREYMEKILNESK